MLYLAVRAGDRAGTILCIYECGMIERMTDTRSLTVARFDLDWVLGEEFL